MGLFDNVFLEPDFALVTPDCRDVPWQTKDIMDFEDRHHETCTFTVGADGRLRRTAAEGRPRTCGYSGQLDLVREGPAVLPPNEDEISLQVLNGVVIRVNG